MTDTTIIDTSASTGETLPQIADVAGAVDAVLDLADDHLAHPQTVEISGWETGNVRVRVFHTYGMHPERIGVTTTAELLWERDNGTVTARMVEQPGANYEGEKEIVLEQKIASVGAREGKSGRRGPD